MNDSRDSPAINPRVFGLFSPLVSLYSPAFLHNACAKWKRHPDLLLRGKLVSSALRRACSKSDTIILGANRFPEKSFKLHV